MSKKTSYQIPFDTKIVPDTDISFPWQKWAGNAGSALDILREAAEGMETLDPPTATAEDVANVLEALRTTLQRIT